MSAVDVIGPKGPAPFGGADLLTWARNQVGLAAQIVDNPGGGLLFATQTMGQVRAALSQADADDAHGWHEVIAILEEAEDAAVRREFARARKLLLQAEERLGR